MSKRIENIRKSMSLLDHSYNQKKNVVKISKANSLEHELAKFLVCWELLNLDKDFVTEARLITGHRADILCIQDAEIIEILHSEEPENPEKRNYPLKIMWLKADEVQEQWKHKLY